MGTKVEEARRDDFDTEADSRAAEIDAGGAALSWKAVRSYVEGCLAGKKPRRPRRSPVRAPARR